MKFLPYIQNPPFVPGKSLGKPELPDDPTPLTSKNFADHFGYNLGHFLFENSYFWEAHEMWEGLWKRQPSSSQERHLLQALIQISASSLKLIMKEPENAENLRLSALQHLSKIESEDAVLGIQMSELIENLKLKKIPKKLLILSDHR